MRLLLLTFAAMIAFAGNSVLNRIAVGEGLIDPLSFAAVRVAAGAAVLVLLMAARGWMWPAWAGRGAGVGGLTVYLLGFSLAYVALDAGIGALILFGAVQITMFAGAVIGKEQIPPHRWAGAVVAFCGVALLLAPGGGGAPSPWHAALMAGAGIGWGIYSLAGRGQTDALGATAANFVLSVPLFLALALLVPGHREWSGVGLAVLSGAVTSGLGYALWYSVLPALGATRAGLAQLSVPLLAAAGGVLFLGEAPTWRFAIAATLVLGGVIVGSRQSRLTSR